MLLSWCVRYGWCLRDDRRQPAIRRSASLEAVRDGAVDDLVADAHRDPAEDPGVHVEIEVHLAAVQPGQRRRRDAAFCRSLSGTAEVTTATERSRRSAASLERASSPPSRLRPRGWLTRRVTRRSVAGRGLAAEQRVQQLRLRRRPEALAVGQRRPQLGRGGDGAAEPEQLVLDRPPATPARSAATRSAVSASSSIASTRSRGARPAGAHHAGDQVDGRAADLLAEHGAGPARPCLPGCATGR